MTQYPPINLATSAVNGVWWPDEIELALEIYGRDGDGFLVDLCYKYRDSYCKFLRKIIENGHLCTPGLTITLLFVVLFIDLLYSQQKSITIFTVIG